MAESTAPHYTRDETAEQDHAAHHTTESSMISDLVVDARDDDSTLGSDASSTTTSLASHATDFRYEHGRRYHAYQDGKYQLPNDEQEMDRLELQHLIWSAVFNGRLYLSPLSYSMTEALDIGCGTGAWAIEFADAHPETSILGTDLSPIQPTSIPPNCSFLIDDATHEWVFPQQFDFIHTRAITFGIGDWDKLVDQAFKALKPGGWLELQEFHLPLGCDDGSMVEGSALWNWGQNIHRAAGKVGIDSLASLKHATRMVGRGFQNVEEAHLKIPLGPWAKGKKEKKIGLMAQKDLLDGIDGISTKLFLMLGYNQEEVKEILEMAKADLSDPNIHTYMPLDVSWGQKPF